MSTTPLTSVRSMTCKAIKTDGSPCQSAILKDGEFCYFHDPAINKEAKKTAQSRGGKHSHHTMAPVPAIPLHETQDVVILLSQVINEVRTGALDPKLANCIGYLAGQLTKAMEVSDLERRMEEIEKKLQAV